MQCSKVGRFELQLTENALSAVVALCSFWRTAAKPNTILREVSAHGRLAPCHISAGPSHAATGAWSQETPRMSPVL